MEIKLFGKSLFSAKSAKADMLWAEATSPKARESKYLPDFYTLNNNGGLIEFTEFVSMDATTGAVVSKAKAVEKPKNTPAKITPKGVFELELLHDKKFKLNADPIYVDQQLADFKDKLGLIKSEEYDMRRGVEELTSVVVRLENRKKYAEYKDFFEEYPYTTTSKINDVIKKHDHLKVGQIAQFIADMPKEAVETMKKYNIFTNNVCGKQAVYYIIADKKDFKKSDTRRDPILLAQSPFGHFWQILGAWDKEMMFLEEL